MIEYGIHSLTLKSTYDNKIKPMTDREKILNTFGLMEQLLRIND